MTETKDFTTKELAAEAGVSDARIRQMLIDGDIKGRKWGRDWMIPRSEAERWLKERRKKSPTE